MRIERRRQWSCFETVVPNGPIVVIGASAGGIEATSTVLRSLPPEFAAPIFVVIHSAPEAPSLLPAILSRASGRETRHPQQGERYRRGVIYVAPPDRHMLLESDGTIGISRGPRENRSRPAIDPLFRSAAIAAGPNVVAVILSGMLDDGTAGMIAVKQRGGATIAQDPEDAIYPAMPQNAIEHAEIDDILPAADIAARIVEAAAQERAPRTLSRDALEDMQMEKRVATIDAATIRTDDRPGTPSAFSCPECGGVLREIEEGNFVRYRCRVGHAYAPETMLGAQGDVIEEALWSALKTLEESASLAKRVAATERHRGHAWMAARFDERERCARERAESIRRVLERAADEPPIEAQQDQHAH